jgi:hypothetical protein
MLTGENKSKNITNIQMRCEYEIKRFSIQINFVEDKTPESKQTLTAGNKKAHERSALWKYWFICLLQINFLAINMVIGFGFNQEYSFWITS